jgi:hypothetical protein
MLPSNFKRPYELLRTMNRLLVTLALSTLFAVGFSTAQECAPAEGEPLILGAVFPPETLLSTATGDSYAGAEAMRQAVNACGGVGGRPVEFDWREASDRVEADQAVRALAEAGIGVVIGSGAPAVTEGAATAANEVGVFYWEMTEAVDPYLTADNQWVFTPRPTAQQLGERAAEAVQTTLLRELALEDVRVALIYEERPLGQAVARGVREMLSDPPLIDERYEDYLDDFYRLGVRMREAEINVVILAAFTGDGSRLWVGAQQADANVDVWLHIGSEGYRRDLCSRARNIEGFMSLSALGALNDSYREALLGGVDRLYRDTYAREFGDLPSLEADLSAMGTFALLHDVLSAVEGDLTAESVRAAALFTEAFSEDGINAAATALIRQQQGQHFCTIFPDQGATCISSVQPFPTWRQRALDAEREGFVCGSEA